MKKETTLNVLKEIRDILKSKELVTLSVAQLQNNEVAVDFPELTAEEIMNSCDNKVAGGKLLYNTDWYKKEDFFTKEKTRKGRRIIAKKLLHKGKSWNQCAEIAKKEDKEMLNFAEVVYLIKENKDFRKLITDWNYTWTSSRRSDGRLVNVGSFRSGEASVNGWTPGYSDSGLGVCFSRSE